MSVNADNNNRVSREQIEQRAYQLYLDRGEVKGYELEDWLRAEDELLCRQEDGRQQRNARMESDASSFANRLRPESTPATFERATTEDAKTSKSLGKAATRA